MAKIKHLAIATNNPEETARFYKDAFGFVEVGKTGPTAKLGDGYFLSDGNLNIAILKFKNTDQIGKGLDYVGLHHFGILVEDTDAAADKLEALGAECITGRRSDVPGFFEVKFRGPDGTVFDIAEHPWVGNEGVTPEPVGD